MTKKLKDEYNIELQEVFDALAIGSLMLIFLKLIILILFGARLHPLFNIFFLFSIALWAYKFQIIIIVRELCVNLLDNCDPLNFFFNPLELTDTSRNKRTPDFEDFKNAFQSILFTLFVTIRLIIYSEPLLFIFFNLAFSYFLLFNKFFYLSFFYTLILSSSRFVFFSSDYNLKMMNETLKEIDSSGGLKEGNRLKVTYRNILAMIAWIYRSYDDRSFSFRDRNKLLPLIYKYKVNRVYTYVQQDDYAKEDDLFTAIRYFSDELEKFDNLLVGFEENQLRGGNVINLFERVSIEKDYSESIIPGFLPICQEKICGKIMYFDSIRPNYYFPYVFSFFIVIIIIFYITLEVKENIIII